MEKLKAFSMFCSTRKMGTSWKMHVQTSMNMLGRDKECSSKTILYLISSFEKFPESNYNWEYSSWLA